MVAAVTPGPSNIMVTAAGANAGLLRGLPCLFGVATGMGLMMFLVPLGLGSVVLGHPLALKALNWGGAAFLLWLSWKIATSTRLESTTEQQPVGYLKAAAFQWINPKSWLVLFFLAALPSCFVWLAFGATIQRILRSPRRLRVFNVTMGVLLAVSIVLIVA